MNVAQFCGPVSSASQITTFPVAANASSACWDVTDRLLHRMPYKSTVSNCCNWVVVTFDGGSSVK